MMSQAVTAKGQVTLRREVLRHLGIKPGERIAVDLVPGGEVRLIVAKPKGSIDAFLGCLKGTSDKVATIEEINEAIEAGWAGER